MGYTSSYKIYVVADMVGGQKNRKIRQTVQKLFKKQQEEDHQ